MISKVDGSLFSGYTVEHFSDHPCFFLLHVGMVETFIIVIMSFIGAVVVYIFIVNMVCTFVPSYMLWLVWLEVNRKVM